MENEVINKLELLTQQYIKRLPYKAREVEDMWLAYKKNNSRDKLRILIRTAHTLKGNAGTYGFILISETAEKLETQLSKLQLLKKAETEAKDALINSIDNVIFDLQQVVIVPKRKRLQPIFEVDKKLQKKISTIYILEEDQNVRLKLVDEINQYNYIAKSFNSFTILLEALKVEFPDMIILSIDFANKIPEKILLELREEVVLIVHTGEQDNLQNRLYTVRHGGQAFLSKPFDYQLLIQTIDNLFEAKRMINQRVMVVDDSKALTDYYQIILESVGLITDKVNDPRNFLSRLQEFQPDLILMDVNMPFCSGTELAQIAYQQPAFSGIPIIFLSSISERAKQMEVLNLAGDDFLVKPVNPKYLLATIRNRLIRSHILRFRMMRDSLTNLYNHTMILLQLEREMLIAKRYARDLTIVLFDIDYFKSINDAYGHQAGDKILKELSSSLQRAFRQSDIIGRYGGEEFLLVMPNTNIDSALRLVDDFRKQFSKMSHMLNETAIYITLSGGVATYERSENINELVKAADAALYQAKEQGRNRIVKATRERSIPCPSKETT